MKVKLMKHSRDEYSFIPSLACVCKCIIRWRNPIHSVVYIRRVRFFYQSNFHMYVFKSNDTFIKRVLFYTIFLSVFENIFITACRKWTIYRVARIHSYCFRHVFDYDEAIFILYVIYQKMVFFFIKPSHIHCTCAYDVFMDLLPLFCISYNKYFH